MTTPSGDPFEITPIETDGPTDAEPDEADDTDVHELSDDEWKKDHAKLVKSGGIPRRQLGYTDKYAKDLVLQMNARPHRANEEYHSA